MGDALLRADVFRGVRLPHHLVRVCGRRARTAHVAHCAAQHSCRSCSRLTAASKPRVSPRISPRGASPARSARRPRVAASAVPLSLQARRAPLLPGLGGGELEGHGRGGRNLGPSHRTPSAPQPQTQDNAGQHMTTQDNAGHRGATWDSVARRGLGGRALPRRGCGGRDPGRAAACAFTAARLRFGGTLRCGLVAPLRQLNQRSGCGLDPS